MSDNTFNNNSLNYNIMLNQGSKIIVSQGVPDNYAFTYVDFAKTEIIMMQDDLTDSKYQGAAGNNYLQLRYLMNGKNNMIVMHKIGDSKIEIVEPPSSSSTTVPPVASGSGVAVDDVQASKNSLLIINNGKQEQLKSYATGIQTTAGSIIPQPLVPSDDFVGYDNGVWIDKQISQSSFTSYGYNWSAFKMTKHSGASGPFGSAISVAINEISLYGVHQDAGYISNQQSRTVVIDYPVIADRKYICNVNNAYCGKGSCVICYKYCTYNLLGQGQDIVQKSKPTFINVKLDQSVISGSGSQTNISGGIQLMIPPDDQITVIVQKYKNQGALNPEASDLLPPQCKGRDNGLLNKPLFIYPLYTGLVVTNSIIKNSPRNSEEIFVKFPAKSDPRSDAYFSGVQPSKEILAFMSGDSGGNMKWFPTLFQQCEIQLRKNITINVSSNENIQFGDNVECYFSKATGNFAYCPLYFHRNLDFSLLFKGQYFKQGNSSGNDDSLVSRSSNFSYYLYPIVYTANPAEWIINNNNYLGKCIQVDNTKSVSGGNGLICRDDYLEQSIYRARFQFTSPKLLRYPLQVFGAVLVMHRKDEPFTVTNVNGDFDISGDQSSSFNFFNLYENIYEYGGQTSDKKFYQLITNCQIQCGLQGVQGNLSLDAYPINQDISTLMLNQSIGQIDLDIAIFNHENFGTIVDNSLLNPNPEIFKGYGMEISVNNQQNNYEIGVTLAGIQQKIKDLKLVCAPFWDGDRLEAVCAYFQHYLKVNLKMINHKCKSIKEALPIKSLNVFGNGDGEDKGYWKSNATLAIGDVDNIASPSFRVPRSWNWESPAVNFATGTSCFQALNKLAEYTSCVFVVGLDGTGYFYELNNYGYPYYVDNQKLQPDKVVSFNLSDISTVSLSPSVSNKYNSIATLGFIIKKKDGVIDQDSIATSTQPGIMYTNIQKDSEYAGKTLFPWTRHNVGMEQGYLTKTQLLRLHKNRILFSISDVFQGTVTVCGNTRVNHVYQVIKINGIFFHVHSIDHKIDLQTKSWTTTYGITFQNISNTAQGASSSISNT